jgi:FlaA1/EpsC-like NDP-sugar epimerase
MLANPSCHDVPSDNDDVFSEITKGCDDCIVKGKIGTMNYGCTKLANMLLDTGAGSCFIDDDVNKQDKFIHGIPIVGDRNVILENVKKYDIQEIIIAMPSVEPRKIKEIALICQPSHIYQVILLYYNLFLDI